MIVVSPKVILLDKAKKYAADSYEYAANEGGPVGKFFIEKIEGFKFFTGTLDEDEVVEEEVNFFTSQVGLTHGTTFLKL